jgi:DNA polymerase-3 subunit beta
LGIETIVEGTIEEKGMIALDAKIFYEIIRRLPDNDITIRTDDKFVATITCEKAKFNIPGKSGEDFAYLPVIEREESLSISQYTLKEMIRQTIFSIAMNENNRLMTGELFEIKDNCLKIVSLDGHRISIRKMPLKREYTNRKLVVPGKTLSEISKILSGEVDDQVSIFFTINHILFEFDQTTVVSRLIEGEYFRIDQMLSSDYETKLTINKKEFLDCIDRATLLVRESDKKPIIIHITDDQMELRIDSAMGSMNEEIDIEKEGKDILIGFNPKFLIDALKVIDDETITIYLVNPKAPCFIRDEEQTYTYLILPVNINQNQSR